MEDSLSYLDNLLPFLILLWERGPILTVASFLQKKGNTPEHNNGIRAFTSIWMPGTLLLSVVYPQRVLIHHRQ